MGIPAYIILRIEGGLCVPNPPSSAPAPGDDRDVSVPGPQRAQPQHKKCWGERQAHVEESTGVGGGEQSRTSNLK